MNASEVRAQQNWGWSSYNRLGWVREKDGRRQYGANFRAPDGPLGFRTLRINFWARRPIVALSTIVQSGQDPNDFNGKTIN